MAELMKLIIANTAQQEIVENLMQLYLHDLSAYTKESVELDGKFDLGDYFGLYWSDADRFPYLCLIDEQQGPKQVFQSPMS